MRTKLEEAIEKIHSIGDEYCENQMYFWPDFDPVHPNPKAYFRKQGVEFDGDLYIRYRVKQTIRPIPSAQIEQEERIVGATLPEDYKTLLQVFGEVHLPGNAVFCLDSPAKALNATRGAWHDTDTPPKVLAVSSYWRTSDGNSIGFIREGDAFLPAIYEFNHELVYGAENTSEWTTRLSDSLADFILAYLQQD
jgi:hypothetical protein